MVYNQRKKLAEEGDTVVEVVVDDIMTLCTRKQADLR